MMPDNTLLPRLFLLSHMRANTSLIGHILGSHPQISGYYEMHLSYTSMADLGLQEQQYCEQDEIKPETIYLFDKLLHNKCALVLHQLPQRLIHTLVSLRAPEQTLKSIMNLFSGKSSTYGFDTDIGAFKYYSERLSWLQQFCKSYSKRYYYYDAEIIRADPGVLLIPLQNWLELNNPLSTEYQIFSRTGQARAGDSSKHMYKGMIVKSSSRYNDIIISEQILEQALKQYDHVRETIITNAIDSVHQ